MKEDQLKEYINEAQRIEEDSLYSSKSHYNAAEFWHRIHLWIGIPNAVLAAAAGVLAFDGSQVLAGSLAVLVASIGAAATFLNPENRSSAHKNAASEYHSLRNRARIFVNIKSKMEVSDSDIHSAFDDLATQRENLNTISPQIPRKAFLDARKGIEDGEATHKS